MTDEMLDLIASGWELRSAEEERGRELWWAVQYGKLPAAHELCERGWLSRRIGSEPEWRLSDQGYTSLSLSAVSPPEGQSLNLDG